MLIGTCFRSRKRVLNGSVGRQISATSDSGLVKVDIYINTTAKFSEFTMDSCWICFVLLMCIIHPPTVLGQGSIAVLEKLQKLDSDVIDLKLQLPGVERKMVNELALTQEYLEAKLIDTIVPKYIDTKVENSLSGFFTNGRLEDMVKGYVVNQLNTLRENLRHMTRKYHGMSRRLKEVETKVRLNKEQLTQDVEDLGRVTTQLSEDLNTTHETLRDMEIEEEAWKEKALNSTIRKVADNGEDGEHWKEHCHKDRLDIVRIEALLVQALRDIEKCQCQKASLGSTTSVSSPATTQSSTTLATAATPRPVEKDMDLLIAPHDSEGYLKLLNLKRNTVSNFPLRMVNVDGITYISSVNSLLISAHDPHTRLVTFDIDSRELTTVQEDIQSYGMTVDDISRTVFMTVNNPTHSISRMDIEGWRYKMIVNIAGFGSTPYGIAVDPRQKMIYAGVGTKLLSVDYDGRNLQTLHIGRSVNPVTIDLTGGFMYFSSESKLMRMSLSSRVTDEVVHLSYNPEAVLHYNNSIYTLRSNDQISVVFLGSKTHRIVGRTLQSVTSSGLAMCLIPDVDN